MLSESYTGGVLDGLAISNRYDAYLRRTNLAALATGAPTEIRGGKDSAKASAISEVNYTYDAASR